MKKLMEAIKSLGIKFAIKQIRAKKDKILTGLNKKIDIPLISEKEERQLLEGVWSLIDDVLKEVEDDSSTSKQMDR